MRSLQAKNAAVVAVLCTGTAAVSLLATGGIDGTWLGSAVLGGLIQWTNLRWLEHSVRVFVEATQSGARPAVATFVALRLAGLLSLVGLALHFLPIAPLPFLIGLSSAVPAAIWHGLPARFAGEGA